MNIREKGEKIRETTRGLRRQNEGLNRVLYLEVRSTSYRGEDRTGISPG